MPAAVADHGGPCAVTTVELAEPLQTMELAHTEQGQPYARVLALIRLHGDPLATVEMPVTEGRMTVDELGDRIWLAVCDRLHGHVRANGCMEASSITREALTEGLPSPTCGPQQQRPAFPLASVVVCTVGPAGPLSRCVSSIVGLTYPNFELVVVDNSSEISGLRELVSQLTSTGARARYVQEPVRGLSRARNRGLGAAAGEIVAFTDDDVEVGSDWLSWIVDQFAADRRVGVVTGLVMPASLDTEQERRFEQFNGYGRGLDVLKFDTDDPPSPDDVLFPYWGAAFGSGNNMAFRRTVLTELGGFDEALGPGTPARNGEEIDAFTGALLRGAKLVYEPRAVCWHYHRSTQDALRMQAFGYAAGATAVFAKWSLRNPRLLPRLLRAAGGALRPGGDRDRRIPREASRLRSIMRMYRQQGILRRQLVGFALGPFLYCYSVVRAHRLPRLCFRSPAPVQSASALLIVVTDGSPERQRTLNQLLSSLGDAADRPEIILVARGDAPTPHETLPIHTLRAPAETGSSRARNLAFRYAREQGLLRTDRIVGFPDDDCVYPTGLIQAVGDVMSETGADVVCGAYAPDRDAIDLRRFPPRRIALTPRVVSTLCPTATTFLTSRVVTEVGLFDEHLGVGAQVGAGEDTDYVLRALEVGYAGLYAPDAIFVRHPYKAHRKSEYYPASVAVLAKHVRRDPRLAPSLAYRLVVGVGWVVIGRLPPARYISAVRGALDGVRARRDGHDRW
jgi:GT2 family glycosyltransferase